MATSLLSGPATYAATRGTYPATGVPYAAARGTHPATGVPYVTTGALTKASNATTTTRVSVMTFNLCGGICRNGEVTRTAAYATNRAFSAKAALAFFQEICYSQYQRVKALVERRGYSAFFQANTSSGACDNYDRRYGKGFGNAMIVKGRATSRVVLSLPTTPGYEKRSLLGATATIGGRRTFVAVVHASPSVAAGLNRELAVLSAYLNAKASRPALVGGDFNATPNHPGIVAIYHSGAGGTGRFMELDEERSGQPERGGQPTFPSKQRKLDYLFASQAHFASPRAGCTATTMSDHCVYIGHVQVD